MENDTLERCEKLEEAASYLLDEKRGLTDSKPELVRISNEIVKT